MGDDCQSSALEEGEQPPPVTVFAYCVQDTVSQVSADDAVVGMLAAIPQRSMGNFAYLLQVPVAGVWA